MSRRDYLYPVPPEPHNDVTSGTLAMVDYTLSRWDGNANMTVENSTGRAVRLGAEVTPAGLFLGVSVSSTTRQVIHISSSEGRRG